MIISVHLPKTGGSTFRTLLQTHFGSRLYLDYDDRPLAHPAEERQRMAEDGARQGHPNLIRDYDCIHGHFLPRKYHTVSGARFVTWMRDPVERVASRYFYTRRRWEEQGERPQHPKMVELFEARGGYPSLEEFVRIPDFQNTYAQYLWQFSIESFDYIGFVETWQASLDKMAGLIGFDAAWETRLNVNPQRAEEGYVLEPALRDIIAASNSEDIRLYQAARRQFA